MSNDDIKNINLYENLLKKYKKGFSTLNWGSSKSQIKRFKVLAEIGISSGDKVLDVGCGLADFYNWIKKNKLQIKYTGLDMTPGMIKESKKNSQN
jgi:ubiquinone/menaquinone biosynthesis C-methylase UbiE